MSFRHFIEQTETSLKGIIDFDTPLAPFTWFKVGGKADCLYRPYDDDDLAYFLSRIPAEVSVTVIGAASNVLVRDGGIRGCVIRLGKGFSDMTRLNNHQVFVGTAVPDVNVAKFLCDNSLAGGSFLRGIPGTIGGAITMNAGAYGSELKDIFIEAYGVSRDGKKQIFTLDDMGFVYRRSQPENIIFTGVKLQLKSGNKQEIQAEMDEITRKRSETQPVKLQTGGSTFKNPQGHQAWKLIDDAGCRGLRVGGAQMSELHCNFMINTGDATAHDLETLGETVIEKVFTNSGVKLEWEIKRIGDF